MIYSAAYFITASRFFTNHCLLPLRIKETNSFNIVEFPYGRVVVLSLSCWVSVLQLWVIWFCLHYYTHPFGLLPLITTVRKSCSHRKFRKKNSNDSTDLLCKSHFHLEAVMEPQPKKCNCQKCPDNYPWPKLQLNDEQLILAIIQALVSARWAKKTKEYHMCPPEWIFNASHIGYVSTGDSVIWRNRTFTKQPRTLKPKWI